MPTSPVVPMQARRVGGSAAGGRTAMLTGLVSTATALVVIAAALLPLLTPWFMHAALALAGASAALGVDPATARHLSDRTLGELLVGPGTFAFSGPDGNPLFDTAERAHLAEARSLLWVALLAGAGAALAIGLSVAASEGSRRVWLWRAISQGGAATALAVLSLALIGVLAFGPLFELFHRVFFPAGNWAFDPASQRLVQLYPMAFWQLAAAAYGALALTVGVAAWWVGGRMASREVRSGATTP